MSQKIRTKFDKPRMSSERGELGGFFDGQNTYLRFGVEERCEGTLDGHKLYRLAKAIVRQFERNKEAQDEL